MAAEQTFWGHHCPPHHPTHYDDLTEPPPLLLSPFLPLPPLVPNLSRTFIIGGGEIYNLAMSSNLVSTIYLTQVSSVPPSTTFDAFFPKLATSDWEVEDIGGGVKTDKKGVLKYQFFKYTKPEEGEDVNPEEMQVSLPTERKVWERKERNAKSLRF